LTPGGAMKGSDPPDPLKLPRRMPTDPSELGRRLREGDRAAAAAALNVIENRADRDATRDLLAEVSPAALGGEPGAHLIGITGPPGAGKSSLLSALVTEWRRRGRTVAVLAVDPSSKRSGGSLLGDRARIDHDPRDDGVLIRSTAAGGRLGGLAAATREAAEALAPAYDVVVIETVGVGQSETDVEDVCDTVAVVVQPASGDVLQFLKAGIMEVPDLLVVTKADLGEVATRSRRDLGQALKAVGSAEVPVMAVSSVPPPTGIEELADALEAHRERSDLEARRVRARRGAALREFTAEHGERALREVGGRRAAERLLAGQDAGASVTDLLAALEAAR
jgi:LAO/AO transport system kinase